MQNSIVFSFLGLCYISYRLFKISNDLRTNEEKWGPFGYYDYFCIAILVFFSGFLVFSGTLVSRTEEENRILARVGRLLLVLVALSVLLAKIFFKRSQTRPKKSKFKKAS